MDFKAYQSRLSQLSARLNLMVCLVFGLLLSNVLLSFFVYKAFAYHTIEITPFSGAPSYFKSSQQVDSHYLSLMAENFINERLNVSPETVDSNHKRLLSFVDSKNYSAFLKSLSTEAKIIKNKKMSSSFDISAIKTNPKDLMVEVSGTLKRYVGLQLIKEERLTYLMQFHYKHGRLSILKMLAQKEKKS